MSDNRERLLQSAMELPEAERLLLATELMETATEEFPSWSLDDPDLPRELEARANDGRPLVPWETLRAQLRAEMRP